MHVARPAIALDPKVFGRGIRREIPSQPPRSAGLGDDLKLFAMTFLGGFVVVSILIG